MPGSYLALDWGLKKVGWATGDELKISITVHPIYMRPKHVKKWSLCEQDIKWLRQILDTWEPSTLVLGLPLGLDGKENSESKGASDLAHEIKLHLGIKPILVNEALSTWESKGKKDEDSESAAIILRDLWSQEARANRG